MEQQQKEKDDKNQTEIAKTLIAQEGKGQSSGGQGQPQQQEDPRMAQLKLEQEEEKLANLELKNIALAADITEKEMTIGKNVREKLDAE